MAHTTRKTGLRIDVPTLEPDAVLVDRLAAASATSTPSRGTSRSVGLRAAFVAVVVASLGATTWAAGALPGVDTPFRHREIQHAPLVPLAPTGAVGSPQSDDSASGSPAPAGLPDHHAQHGQRARHAHPARPHHRGAAHGHRDGHPSAAGKGHGHHGGPGRRGKHRGLRRAGGHGPLPHGIHLPLGLGHGLLR